jgi:hypothetical protein
MSNTSATGGFLQEQSTPLGITALEDLWHDTICGVTGLDNTLVRPSRQLDPAQQPDALTDWCAFDIVRVSSDPWLDVAHVSTGQGSDSVVDHDLYEVGAVFYGPNSDINAGLLRRGLYVWQNRSALRSVGIALQSVGDPVTVPELDSMVWRQRVDLSARFIVESRGSYAVLNLLRSTGDIIGDDGSVVTFDTEEVKPHG